MTITLPPVEASHQFLHSETEFEHVDGALGRAVTPDAVAIGDDEGRSIESARRFGAHRPVGDVDRPGNMLPLERLW